MKRLRSSEDLDSLGEKGACKDWGRREEESSSHRSLMHRNSYYKSENARKGLSSSSSRYDRIEDDRDSSRPIRKRSDYDVDSYDRRKSYDRYREGTSEKGISSSSPRSGYSDRIHRSESFSGLRRDVPKGFRSERDRSRREGSVSSWRKFGQGKDGDDGSRSYNDSGKGSRLESDDAMKIKSPRLSKDVKSPPWSKDSGSEQSKSVEVKRSEDMPIESSGKNSEMEEGELEPDPQPLSQAKNTTEDQSSGRIQSSQMDERDLLMQQDRLEDQGKSKSAGNMESSKESRQDEREECRSSESFHVSSNEGDDLAEDQNVSPLKNVGCDENETVAGNCGSKLENVSTAIITCTEEISESQTLEEKEREHKSDESNHPEQDDKLSEGTGECLAIPAPVVEEVNDNLKDKGKTVVLPASNCTPLTDQFKIVSELRGPVINEDSYQEGPSTRGLDLFRRDPVRATEKELQWSNSKTKDEKLTLDLSLSLPNVLLPIDAHNSTQAPASPSRGRSIQSFQSSFRTDSEGFTPSMSFSGSQYFSHNPSCSLTHEAFDNEQSVKSRPLFQGVDWQAVSSGEMKHKELPPIVQKLLAEENGQAFQGNSSSQAMAHPKRTVEGSVRTPVSLERHLSFSKQYSGGPSQMPNEIPVLSQGVGSQETGSGFLREKKQALKEIGGGDNLCKSSNQEGREQQLNIGADFFESVMTSILSESLTIVAQRFREMSGQQISFLKDSVRDMIQSPSGHRQVISFQKALKRRSNITLEMLLNLHQPLLEILVAMKTGVAEYLHKADITPSSLAEIFLKLRCRNPNCHSLLPADECDCRFCAQRNGFCRECMCLVCSKFDMSSNTCSWVGCDVCLHWCHVECGLRESYIRNGRSASGSDSTTEMQFHCLACDHPSEMFGFVKEVFQNFAKDWTADDLSRELEHVRRIFSASEDLRGKQLHKVAIQMLLKLENKVTAQEVKQYMMGFLTDSDSLKRSNSTFGKVESSPRNDGKSNGIAGCSPEVQWPKSVTFDRTSQYDKSGGLFPSLDGSRNSKDTERIDLQVSMPKEHGFDELESIIRIKHAESKMFQTRADDARREAAALKRIATTKSERIEEEYTSRIAKLRLADAEEMRKQKIEELQVLDRAFQDYFRLKMRMETDIKDLLLKMDATRRNLNL